MKKIIWKKIEENFLELLKNKRKDGKFGKEQCKWKKR